MTRPNFLCVGAAKSGTTTLHSILSTHPDVFLPSVKECHFFDYEENFTRGIDWYKKEFFRRHQGQNAIGETTPSYMYIDYVPKRLYSALGSEVKLVFMLRNPVDRAYSHYLMMRRRGREDRTFEEAITLENRRISKNLTNRLRYSYVSRGFYAEQITRYLELFPANNLFFLVFEDQFLRNLPETLDKLQRFIGVEVFELPYKQKENTASQPRSQLLNQILYSPPPALRQIIRRAIPSWSIRLQTRRWLASLNSINVKPEPLNSDVRSELMRNYFMADIQRLESILGRDLTVWYHHDTPL